MILSSKAKEILIDKEYSSFTEGFEDFDQFTLEYVTELNDIMNILDDDTTTLLSESIMVEGISPNLKNKLIDIKNGTKKSFMFTAKWINKTIAWAKSFLLESSKWVHKNERRIKQNAHKLYGRSTKLKMVDHDGVMNVIASAEGSIDHIASLFDSTSKDDILHFNIPESISFEDVTEYKGSREYRNKCTKVTEVSSVNVDHLINDVYKSEDAIRGIIKIKNNLNQLKGKVDKFIDSLDTEASSEVFTKAYQMVNYFKTSISSIMQALITSIRIINSSIKQNLRIFRSII